MQNSNKTRKLTPGTPMFGVATGLAGVAVALCFIYFGWRSLLILALFVLGYVVGTQCIGAVKVERSAAKAASMRAGLVTGIIGIVVALSFIFFGFWRTLLIAVLFAVGYVLGFFGYNALKAEKVTVDAAVEAQSEESEE